MDLHTVLKKNGIAVSSNMDAEKLVGLLRKATPLLSAVPSLSGAVNTLGKLNQGVLTTKNTLATAKSTLESVRSSYEQARDKVMLIVGATPIGGPAPAPNPALSATAALQTFVETTVPQAEAAVSKAEEAVESAQNAVYSQVGKIVDLILRSKV